VNHERYLPFFKSENARSPGIINRLYHAQFDKMIA